SARERMELAEVELIQQSWQPVNCSPLEYGTFLLARLFAMEAGLLLLFQYEGLQFSSPEDCLPSSEFLDHIRKVMLVINTVNYFHHLGRKHWAVSMKLISFLLGIRALPLFRSPDLGPAHLGTPPQHPPILPPYPLFSEFSSLVCPLLESQNC
uniref:Uncharacterized protein n=1 Tax=Castor canadensis TaxID=51338 RepID=A0A8C0VZK8_CASCN